MPIHLNRRQSLASIGAAAGGLLVADAFAEPTTSAERPFRFCFNTSTIRGQQLTLDKQIDVARKAGYSGIEPWISDIAKSRSSSGGLLAIKQQLADADLAVESAIGFARWIVDDDSERQKGLKQAAREMELVKAIGGSRIAAPPVGATGPMNLDTIAERYHALLIDPCAANEPV